MAGQFIQSPDIKELEKKYNELIDIMLKARTRSIPTEITPNVNSIQSKPT